MGKRLEGHVRTNIDGQSAALPLARLHDSDFKGMAILRFSSFPLRNTYSVRALVNDDSPSSLVYPR